MIMICVSGGRITDWENCHIVHHTDISWDLVCITLSLFVFFCLFALLFACLCVCKFDCLFCLFVCFLFRFFFSLALGTTCGLDKGFLGCLLDVPATC